MIKGKIKKYILIPKETVFTLTKPVRTYSKRISFSLFSLRFLLYVRKRNFHRSNYPLKGFQKISSSSLWLCQLVGSFLKISFSSIVATLEGQSTLLNPLQMLVSIFYNLYPVGIALDGLIHFEGDIVAHSENHLPCRFQRGARCWRQS